MSVCSLGPGRHLVLTGDCLNFCLPVVSPDRGVVLHYPVAGIGAMLSAHPVTQWWRQGSASSKRCWAGRSASLSPGRVSVVA